MGSSIRCEVLRIKVENAINVFELVYSMPCLRALNVQIWNEIDIPDFHSSATNDKLVSWLCHSLGSTCTVLRRESSSRCIQMWVR